MLAREAYTAAADKTRFPEQLRWVEPWQAARLVSGGFGGGRGGGAAGEIRMDTGEFDPLLGFSYTEIAGMSRSMHRTQGMGAPERRGPSNSSASSSVASVASSHLRWDSSRRAKTNCGAPSPNVLLRPSRNSTA